MVAGIGGTLGDGLQERIEELLGDVRRARRAAALPSGGRRTVPPRWRCTRKHRTRRTSASACRATRSTPGPLRAQVLSTILGGGMSSRLFTEVRERRGLAYYVYGYNQSYTDAGSSTRRRASTSTASTTQSPRSPPSSARSPRTPSDGRAREGQSFAKGRFVLSLETSQGMIMFGLRREVLEGRTPIHGDPGRDREGHCR